MTTAIHGSDQFAKLCSRTSATDYVPIKERLENRALEYEMITLMERLSGTIRKLDDIKKYAFYGKLTPYIENVLKSEMESVGLSYYTEKNIGILHSVVGITTESGELLEMLLHHLKGGYPIDDVNFVEELGDVSWYVAEGSRAVNIPLSTIHTIVIEKLKKRFPDKFTNEKAITRDLKVERELLEESMNLGES